MALTDVIENYPGFDSISGPEFSDKLSSSAFSLGAEIEPGNVISVEKSGDVIKVKYDGGEKECRAFIFATGATHRHTGVKGEDVFSGRGVSFCAVCDGNFFKGKEVAVIGGGNSAVQEAIYLSSVCSKVYTTAFCSFTTFSWPSTVSTCTNFTLTSRPIQVALRAGQ